MCERHVFRILCLAACASIAGCMTSSDKCGSDQEVYCFDRCIDPLSNPSYCGLDSTCTTYETCKEGQLCNDGKCVAATCGEGKVVCANECVDPKTNLVYCGANATCDQYETCPAETMCIDGVCKVPAPDCPVPSDVFCGGLCINPKTNNTFCGITAACMDYRTCKPGATCVDGKCTEPCAGKEILCGGICIDPKTNNAFCGISNDCNGFEVCGNGTQCVDGKCVDANTCAGDEVLCGGMCIDPKTNNTFCGIDEQCGNYQTCATGEECVDGRCKATKECAPGQILCGGVCIDPKTNNSFCGIDAQCSGFATCSPSEACVDGKCKPFLPTANDCDAEAGEIKCGNVCINPKTDPLYCGIAADCTGYSRCADGAACVDGVCTAKQTCLETEKLCGGICIDPKTNDVFCGMKDDCKTYTSCPAGASCVDGACATCQGDEVLCGGFCIDPDTNSTFCGMSEDCSSYKTCTQNESCVDGECVANKTCQTGEILLGSVCIDPKTNNAFCGMKPDFSSYTNCKPGQYCDDGVCKNYSVCTEGMVSCDGRCINPNRDEKYCGADATCQNYEVCGEGQKCRQGVCKTVQSCEPGEVFCTDTNTCIDPKFDDAHCGADPLCESFTACKAGERCESGKCQPNPQCGEVAATTEGGTPTPIFCEIGQFCHVTTTTATPPVTTKTCKPSIKACSGRTVDIRNDVSNCGDCNVKCGDNQVCTDGVCVAVTPTNQDVEVYCGGILTKLGDDMNCSKCGDTCSSIQNCTDMVCVDDPDYKLCGNQKTYIKEDPANCGDCGVKCNESTQSCEDKKCTDIPGIVLCNEGTTETPKDVYRNTNIDSLNCGGCGKKCGIEAPACVKGKCVAMSQNPTRVLVCGDVQLGTDGKRHCIKRNEVKYNECMNEYCKNESPTDCWATEFCEEMSCEMWGKAGSWRDDPKNCGACGNACAEGNECNEGVCNQTCSHTEGSGTVSTNNINLAEDSMHCGACNYSCPKGSRCSSGVCKPQDQVGGDLICNNERVYDANENTKHCGSCGNQCPEKATCKDGYCGVNTCTKDGKTLTNIHLMTDSEHCGVCNKACPANTICKQGSCVPNTDNEELVCSNIHINPKDNGMTCGSCSNVCPKDKPICDKGSCRALSAGDMDQKIKCGYKDNGDAVEVNISSDSAHCEGCGIKCEVGKVCKSGNCQPMNEVGADTHCNDSNANLGRDRNNCGQCGRAVGMKKVCENGEINDMTENNAKDQECPGVFGNVNLWNTHDHCGDCNNKCAKGQLCVAGECVSKQPPFADGTTVIQSCNNGSHWGGYEEYNVSKGNRKGDGEAGMQNCGYCGKMCTRAKCDMGLCGRTCDGIEEIDTKSDSYYCGGCVVAGEGMDGETCKEDTVCKDGTCQEGDTTSVTCKGVSGINLSIDSANCGKCGEVLKPIAGENRKLQICKGGKPAQVPPDKHDETKTQCNGKITYLDNDSSNCGQCDNVCEYGTYCKKGECIQMLNDELKVPDKGAFFHIICGYENASKAMVALPAVDSNNCGGCGIKCERGKYCNEGKCKPIDRDTMATSYCGTGTLSYKTLSDALTKSPYSVSNYINGVNHTYKDKTLGTFIDGSNHCSSVENAISQDGVPSGYKTAGIYRTLSYDPNNCGACGYNCKEQLDGDRDYYCIGGKCVWNDVIKQCKEDHEENTGKPSDYCMCK